MVLFVYKVKMSKTSNKTNNVYLALILWRNKKKSINRLKIKQHCFNQLKTGKLSDHMSNNENHHAMPISEWRHWCKKKRA